MEESQPRFYAAVDEVLRFIMEIFRRSVCFRHDSDGATANDRKSTRIRLTSVVSLGRVGTDSTPSPDSCVNISDAVERVLTGHLQRLISAPVLV